MIIATVGMQKYLLRSIEDAEQLMKILGVATPIQRDYESKNEVRFYVDHRPSSIEISIENGELLSWDDDMEDNA